MGTLDAILTRRTFLLRAGHGTIALAVVGIAGCAPAGSGGGATVSAAAGPTSGASGDATPSGASAAPSASASGGGGAGTWQRVDLGFVSAYVFLRAGEAAVVDTGTPGSEGAIEAVLGTLGVGWDAVGHVILTHLHQDHAGAAAAVLTAAPDATGYAGEPDLAGIAAPRPLTAVADGDRVFDLRIVATPGHTPGSISILDETGSVLVAGDALRTDGDAPALPSPEFTEDMDVAAQSVTMLGGLPFETLYVGHGAPIESGAAAQVAALAAG